MRFTSRSLLIPLAIAADLFALWVWLARPTRIYSEWLGLSPVPDDSPITRLRGWAVQENAPGTPSGCVSLFESDELAFAGTLLFALLVFAMFMLAPRSQGWRGLLSTSPVRVMRNVSLRFRVRTALAAVAILALYLGWEIDAWKIWPLRRSYLQQAASAASTEESTRNRLRTRRKSLIELEKSQPADFSLPEQGYFRSTAALAAVRASNVDRRKREMSHLSTMISAYAERKRKYERAAANPRTAVTPDPPLPEPTPERETRLGSRNYARALADADELVRIYPDLVEAHEVSARIRATCPDAGYRDGKRAVASATRACELTNWKDTEALTFLSAAFAEAGDFAEAVKWQEKVVELTANFPHAQFSLDRLALYKSGKPYRER